MATLMASLSLSFSLLLCSSALADTVRISDDPGGRILERKANLEHINRQGYRVEVTGKCLSACTMVLAHIDRDNLCFGPQARLGFHLATNKNREPMYRVTEHIIQWYPASIQKWIEAKGGVYQMPYGSDYWYLSAQELYGMGFLRCK